MNGFNLSQLQVVLVHQVHELGELFGFETRNKYQILNAEQNIIGYAAEQQKGIFGFLLRQYLGHWRKFDVHFFTSDRQLAFIGSHPFRWFFQRIEVKDPSGRILGAVQQRFSIFTKRFDIENSKGVVIMEVASPIWKIWTFNFMAQGQQVAQVLKQWSGIFTEGFTDKDNFMIQFTSPKLSDEEKTIVMASAVFIDLLYFENKQ